MKRILQFCALLGSFCALAQSPIVKVDLNMSGRTELECNDPNYTPWIPDNATSSSKTMNGVTFTFKKAGSNGTNLRMTYYKAGIQTPYYARLGSDAMYIDGGNAGAQIELTISGLTTGTHSLMTFHNTPDSPETNDFAPQDIYVNGALAVNNLAMSERALTLETTQSSYITFEATAGKSVVIAYRAETSGSQNNKNVYINGFELNTPNVKDQSKNPNPEDGDVHANADNGSATLKWTAAPGATKHRIYFGIDQNCVTNGSSSCYKGEQTATTLNVSSLSTHNTYYWRVDEVTSAGVVTKGNTWLFRPRRLAFPGAEGHGRFAIGGRGGKVVHVTNLKDDLNAGSFRYAVEVEKGPRTIVFDVGGVIILTDRLVISDPYVTVAAQTAPGQGVCVRRAPMGLTGNDGITRFLRVQIGYGITYDGMGMTGCNHSIADHCSINFAIDEQFSSRGGRNLTLQNTLIAEALNVADHDKKPAGTAHGYAGSVSGDIGSYHHLLLAHNEGRNFSMAGGLDGNAVYAGRMQMVNIVCYNWCGRTTDGGIKEIDFINNYYNPGAASKIFTALNVDHEATGSGGMQRAYFNGNVMPGYFDESTQSKGRKSNVWSGATVDYETFVTSPFSPTYVTTQSAGNAFKVVLSDVGANQPFQTDREIRIINETKTGTYKYKGSKSGKPGLPDREGDVGGFDNFTTTNRAANWDSDKDGLPDIWEKMIGTSNSSSDFSDANADPDNDGYTNLEDYLNWLATPHYFLNEGGSQTIELKDAFLGFGSSATFAVSDAKGGKATISGSKATFVPTGCGIGSFVIKATESGFTMSRTVGVLTNGTGTCTLVTGIAETDETDENTLAFPNPFSDQLTVKQKGVFFYQIFDVNGKEVGAGHGENKTEVGQNLLPGMYMLKIQSEGQSKTMKIVKANR